MHKAVLKGIRIKKPYPAAKADYIKIFGGIKTMNTMNVKPTVTVRELTEASTTMQYAHFTDPTDPDRVIIDYKGVAIVVSKRMWNMLSLGAPIEDVKLMSEVRKHF